MTVNLVEQIADAILYEGYNLYPYRPTAVKNHHRWMFGVLYPESYCAGQLGSDDWRMQTECLVTGNARAVVEVNVRFLHLVDQRVYELVGETTKFDASSLRPTAFLQIGQKHYFTWQEAEGRTLPVKLQRESLARKTFSFPSHEETIAITDDTGQPVGQLVREQQSVQGIVEVAAERCDSDTFKLSVTIENHTHLDNADRNNRDQALLRSLVSTHSILTVEGGEFISLLDPPINLRESAESCQNVGTWPVLAGEPGSRKVMLSSPIILSDYPRVAPESPGDLFDGTEIDELLLLRIQTLTDEEKREMAGVDERTRQLLERTESLTCDQMLDLHAASRVAGVERSEPPRSNPATDTIQIDGVKIRRGTRVRLQPGGRADAFDLVLNGMAATVQSIEEDFENNVYVTVTVDDDPGKDLGCQGKPGHRFFFRPDEISPIGKHEEGKQ